MNNGPQTEQAVRDARNAMRAACEPRMLLLHVSFEVGNRTDGNSAAAQRHYLGPAFAGSISGAAVPGTGRCQSAPRGNDDLCYRRRFQQVDVLGSHIADTSAVVELVHFVR